MASPQPMPGEEARLEALRSYRILDTPPDESFDRLTRIAAQIFGVPTALVTLIDQGRQWFKSRIGMDVEETSREIAFCAYTILGSEVLVIEDTLDDERFVDNPLVTGEPRIRFYAGAPLRVDGGHTLGSFAVIDYKPRCFSARERWLLSELAAVAVDELELWRRLQIEKEVAVGEVVRESQERLRRAEKMEALGHLAGGVAHDFNNVLGVILSYASFALERVEADDPVREHLAVIRDAVDRGAALTRRILAFGQRQALRRERLSLNAAIHDAVAVLRRVLPGEVELRLALARRSPVVLADVTQVQQIIWNLCINARDAMPTGGVITLHTSTRALGVEEASGREGARPGTYGVLEVEDTGVGMESDVRERIFEPYFTTKEPGRGTGLGLASVHGSVRQHEGFVDVVSAVGEGSVFRVYLPAAEPPPEANTRP